MALTAIADGEEFCHVALFVDWQRVPPTRRRSSARPTRARLIAIVTRLRVLLFLFVDFFQASAIAAEYVRLLRIAFVAELWTPTLNHQLMSHLSPVRVVFFFFP